MNDNNDIKENKRRYVRAMASCLFDENLNTDFYKYLSNRIISQLQALSEEFGDREWFAEAWEGYREYVIDEVEVKNKDTISWPRIIFNKYMISEYEKNQKELRIPILVRWGLWQCPMCNKYITDSMTSERTPSRCPHCGSHFIRCE